MLYRVPSHCPNSLQLFQFYSVNMTASHLQSVSPMSPQDPCTWYLINVVLDTTIGREFRQCSLFEIMIIRCFRNISDVESIPFLNSVLESSSRVWVLRRSSLIEKLSDAGRSLASMSIVVYRNKHSDRFSNISDC